MTLIPLAAIYLRNITQKGRNSAMLPQPVRYALLFTAIVITAALVQINQGWFLNKGIDKTTGKRIGIKDITLDLYGWEQLREGFTPIYQKDTASGQMRKDAIVLPTLVSGRKPRLLCSPPLGIKLLTLAELERTHKYAWITQYRGGFEEGMDAWYFSSSYDFSDPNGHYKDYFARIGQPDTIPVYRNGDW
ncbi:MAG: hypothetical protein IPH20_15010 [Bacteroidales bacterium]|nr:hypothetical protein [Bacteroidales bacterium]